MVVDVPFAALPTKGTIARKERNSTMMGQRQKTPFEDAAERVSRAYREVPNAGHAIVVAVALVRGVVLVEHHSSSSQLTRARSCSGGALVAVAHTMQGLRHDHKGDRDREGNCVDGVVVGAMISVGVVLVEVVVAMDCDPCPLVSTSTNRARC